MNTTKVILFTLLTIFSINMSQGHSRKDTSSYDATQLYAHSFKFTNSWELTRVLTDDACYQIPMLDNVSIETKDEILADAKFNEGMIEDCTTRITMLSASNRLCMYKVTFRFTDFHQDHFVLVKKIDNTWKISQVVKMFIDRV